MKIHYFFNYLFAFCQMELSKKYYLNEGDDKNMAKLEKEVRGIMFDLLDDEELKINDNDEIEYTQEWLNNWLMSWILDGYTTKEVMKIREYFENFEYEEQVEKSYQVGVITYDNGQQEAEWEDEIVDVTVTTKKIA